jgi:hypothetical protein
MSIETTLAILLIVILTFALERLPILISKSANSELRTPDWSAFWHCSYLLQSCTSSMLQARVRKFQQSFSSHLCAGLAGELDLRDDQQMLHESLEEEKQADLRLTKVAKREVNPDALAA